jgi:hypothetical protein
MSLFKTALNIPYQRWQEIEPLIASTNDAHTKEVLRRLMYVKRNRTIKDGNSIGTSRTKEHLQGHGRAGNG